MPSVQLAWKRRLGQLYQWLPTYGDRRVILIYHSIGSTPFALPERAFRAQIDWLIANAKVVSLEKILDDSNPSGLVVAISFDDGYQSIYKLVAPILKQAELPASVYLNSMWIGDEQRLPSDFNRGHYPGEEFLLWNEVVQLREFGWTIGSHGADHVDLTLLPETEVFTQLTRSKATIEERLDSSCIHFAYTWGHHNRRVRAAVAECGYSWAVAAVHGVVSPTVDRYAVPRIDIRNDYKLEDFIAIVRGEWDYLRLLQRTRRLLR
ncbi:MAG TPA: polysaccharide deacetylase family protein [Candidatus Binatia bacterium]|jgi:peptidoglycan/xylan/chitin deacetylase (PgdA/CDA1 family)